MAGMLAKKMAQAQADGQPSPEEFVRQVNSLANPGQDQEGGIRPEDQVAAPEQSPLAEQDDTPPEQDPAFVAAVTWLRRALYEDGAADHVHRIMQNPGADQPGQLATLAYELAQQADAVTNGEIDDTNLVSLGVFALAEVGEIAEASGAELEPAAMASALKTMMFRYLQESGAPAEQIQQLQAAMNQITPQQFNEIAQAAQQQADTGGQNG